VSERFKELVLKTSEGAIPPWVRIPPLPPPSAPYAATWTFVAIWLVISGANLWVGVTKAGYILYEELPIFLLIFAVPTVVAILLK
jgi:hypothetical protein